MRGKASYVHGSGVRTGLGLHCGFGVSGVGLRSAMKTDPPDWPLPTSSSLGEALGCVSRRGRGSWSQEGDHSRALKLPCPALGLPPFPRGPTPSTHSLVLPAGGYEGTAPGSQAVGGATQEATGVLEAHWMPQMWASLRSSQGASFPGQTWPVEILLSFEWHATFLLPTADRAWYYLSARGR